MSWMLSNIIIYILYVYANNSWVDLINPCVDWINPYVSKICLKNKRRLIINKNMEFKVFKNL